MKVNLSKVLILRATVYGSDPCRIELSINIHFNTSSFIHSYIARAFLLAWKHISNWPSFSNMTLTNVRRLLRKINIIIFNKYYISLNLQLESCLSNLIDLVLCVNSQYMFLHPNNMPVYSQLAICFVYQIFLESLSK